MTEKAKQVRLTIPQSSILWTTLEAHCRQVGGMAVYEPGWDDEKVAEAVDIATASHVATLRLKHFGKLAAPGFGEEVESLKARLAALEADVKLLREEQMARERADATPAAVA